MATTFILLSKVSLRNPGEVRALSQMDVEFDRRIERECPQVKRIASYALLGEYDFLHIFEAPDARTAAQVALLSNAFGACTTQTLTAIPFDEFSEIARNL